MVSSDGTLSATISSRKRVATISQLLNLKDHELDWTCLFAVDCNRRGSFAPQSAAILAMTSLPRIGVTEFPCRTCEEQIVRVRDPLCRRLTDGRQVGPSGFSFPVSAEQELRDFACHESCADK